MITKNWSDVQIKYNLITFMAGIIISALGILYGNQIRDQFDFLRVWEIQNIFFLVAALPFLFLQTKADLPNFWENGISNKQRFLIPVSIGVFFGILDIIVIKMILHPEVYTELPPFLQPFPYSCFLFFSGSLEIEIFYRLIPLTMILLLGKWYKKGQYFHLFFWAGVVVTSVREPLEQLPQGAPWLVVYALCTGFLMNSLQAIYYRKSGFLASLSVRWGHYLLWHILLGIYVQYFELL